MKDNRSLNNNIYINNNNQNKDIDNSILFFKLFRNIIIKNEIINHLKLYNNHYHQRIYNIQSNNNNNINHNSNNNNHQYNSSSSSSIRIINETIDDFNNYKFKYYLKSIKLILNEDNKNIIVPIIIKYINNSNIDTVELVDDYVNPNYFKSEFPIDLISPTVKYLKLRLSYLNINNKIIPSTIESLHLPNTFNQPLVNVNTGHSIFARYGLKVLVLGSNFNCRIGSKVLPDSLTKLDLGQRYSHPLEIGSVPDSVTHLELSNFYNHPIGLNVLPSNLKYLYIKGLFNQIIQPHVLPASLKSLQFGQFSKFNQPLSNNSLPSGLEILTFRGDFDQVITTHILSSAANSSTGLLQLSLSQKFKQELNTNEFKFPDSITRLNLSCRMKSLQVNILPRSLRHLVLSDSIVIQSSEVFSGCIGLIKVSGCSLHHIKNLPPSIQKIKFNECFDEDIPTDTFSRFNNLISINFGLLYNQPLKYKSIPTTVKEIKLKGLFNQQLPLYLNHISSLELGDSFNSNNNNNNLNNLSNLKYLNLYINNHNNNNITLPDSITILNINIINNNNYNHNNNNNHNHSNEQQQQPQHLIINNQLLPNQTKILIISNGNPKIELPLPQSLESIYIHNDNTSILKDYNLFYKLYHLIKVIDCNSKNKIKIKYI